MEGWREGWREGGRDGGREGGREGEGGIEGSRDRRREEGSSSTTAAFYCHMKQNLSSHSFNNAIFLASSYPCLLGNEKYMVSCTVVVTDGQLACSKNEVP